jgi:hypothetical protein
MISMASGVKLPIEKETRKGPSTSNAPKTYHYSNCQRSSESEKNDQYFDEMDCRGPMKASYKKGVKLLRNDDIANSRNLLKQKCMYAVIGSCLVASINFPAFYIWHWWPTPKEIGRGFALSTGHLSKSRS